MRDGPDVSLSDLGAALAERPYAKRGVRMSDRILRVLIADDHTLFRAGLTALLRKVDDIEVVGEAPDGHEALALAARLSPDVVVMDLDMPGMDGLTATRALIERQADARVLVLTMHAEEEHLLEILDAGACGYLTKESAERELADAIRVVASGDVYVRPQVARLLAAHRRARARDPDADKMALLDLLSDRERAVVTLTAEGYGGVEIGARLGISNKSVETYKQRIRDKIGLKHRTEYVRFALDTGLLHR